MPPRIKAALRGHDVPLPPVSMQRRVVEIFGKADDLLRLRARADAMYKELLPSIFHEIFGGAGTTTRAHAPGATPYPRELEGLRTPGLLEEFVDRGRRAQTAVDAIVAPPPDKKP
jgi:hypothetical protein